MQKIHVNQVQTSELFYQFPKALLHSDSYKQLSLNAKMLYVLMKDRHALSVKNHYIDSDGFVYIIYTLHEIMTELALSNPTAIKVKQELIDADLIECTKTIKADQIYVGNLVSTTDHKDDFMTSKGGVKKFDSASDWEVKKFDSPELKNFTFESKEIELSKVKNFNPSNNDSSKTDLIKTDFNLKKDEDEDASHYKKTRVLENETPIKNPEKEVIDLIKQEMGLTLNPRQQEMISTWCRENNPLDLVEAVYITAENGGHSLKYLYKTLKTQQNRLKELTATL